MTFHAWPWTHAVPAEEPVIVKTEPESKSELRAEVERLEQENRELRASIASVQVTMNNQTLLSTHQRDRISELESSNAALRAELKRVRAQSTIKPWSGK